jgi:hypothetical protein
LYLHLRAIDSRHLHALSPETVNLAHIVNKEDMVMIGLKNMV